MTNEAMSGDGEETSSLVVNAAPSVIVAYGDVAMAAPFELSATNRSCAVWPSLPRYPAYRLIADADVGVTRPIVLGWKKPSPQPSWHDSCATRSPEWALPGADLTSGNCDPSAA